MRTWPSALAAVADVVTRRAIARLAMRYGSVLAGLTLVLVGDTLARNTVPWAEWLFWLGLLVLLVPTAARIVSDSPSDNERIALVTILAVAIYAVKFLHSPSGFTLHDEFIHWRTAQDLVSTGEMFHSNPLLPVSPLYPGLESVTAAVSQVAGIGTFAAGIIVIGASRVVLTLALYMTYRLAGGSDRLAGIASVIYMANPNYLFFDSQFSYESLALTLVALALFLLQRRRGLAQRHRIGLNLLLLLGLLALVPTHHLSTYALIVFLVLWAIVAWFTRAHRDYDEGPLRAAIVLVVATAGWLAFVASRTIGYLVPNLMGSILDQVRLLTGQIGGRELFRTTTGQIAPLWERGVAFASVALILLALPVGFLYLSRHHRTSGVAVALGLAAVAYPASLAFRLTPLGAEVSNRASEFLFVPIAFVLAVAVVHFRSPLKVNWRGRALFAGWVSVLFVGGTVIGFAPWARVPGPYLVSADPRSIEPEGIAAARWLLDRLGPGNRLVADRTNALLMGTYGNQHPVTDFGDRVNTAAIVLSRHFGKRQQSLMQQARARYVVIDFRLTTQLPLTGVYFERGEVQPLGHLATVEPQMLTKFDHLPGVRRVFDSGDIVVYDFGG